MRDADDQLPSAPQRILIAGVSGAGKSTLARRIEGLTKLPYVELDSLFHGPNWTPLPSFIDEVTIAMEAPCWIMDWQYKSARPLLLQKADLLIWLDLPTPLVLSRVILRTLRRRAERTVLWNGNVEGPLWQSFFAPTGIVRWAVRTRSKYRRTVPEIPRERPDVVIVRLRSKRDVTRWMSDVLPKQFDGL